MSRMESFDAEEMNLKLKDTYLDYLDNYLTTNMEAGFIVASAPRSSFAEMLRSMRTRIEFVVQRKSNIMITITSTQPADGKTFTSTNLAASYAMTGKNVDFISM